MTSLVMKQKLCWIIVVVLVLNKISFASSINVKVGTFRYLHRHPKLKSCAMEALKKDLYVGGRVNMLTGECEGLNRSWGLNQTVQSGYAYTKKVSAKEGQSPPFDGNNDIVQWTIPGVLREGATIAAVLDVPLEPSPYYAGFALELYDILDPLFSEDKKGIVMRAYAPATEAMSEIQKFEFCERPSYSCFDDGVCTPPKIRKKMKTKILLRVHTGSVELLVDDHEICMVNTTVDLTTMRSIIVWSEGLIHGVEFIDA